ncbi:YibE/F family protein [Companilactobacillus metriopterae]|uniref:YibE/F family protein n=1 Tax=Companilactobacillus metriopterae TaxID=1909267 RepID=UPI00100A2604|nr:YibE/F family protein [Companilactobacillus metriopterae]
MSYLFIAFILLSIVVMGKRSLTFLFGLGINVVLILVLVIMIADGFDPIITTVVISIFVLVIAIYLNVENYDTANTAFKTSLIIMLLILGITFLVQHYANFQGMWIENQEELEGFSLQLGISFPEIAIAIIVINSLGVISETSVAISSGLNEIIDNKPDLTDSEIFNDGFSVGNKILITQINTMLLNFFASTFTLIYLMHSLKFTNSEFINDKLLVAEILTTLVCIIGVIFTVPITSYFTVNNHKKRA